jgi:outer membrane protein
MKKNIIATTCTVLACAGALAQTTAEGPWMVRARAVYLDSANNDSTGLNLSINNKWMPEADITYFVSPNVSVELVLTVPQKHTVSAGSTEIGTLRHLPPTLLAQYRFTSQGNFQPYLGAGVNFTRFSSVSLPTGVDVSRNSWGLAFQAGVDVPIAKGTYLNFDIKKVYIQTDVSAGVTTLGTFKVDPVLLGVGIGWRF